MRLIETPPFDPNKKYLVKSSREVSDHVNKKEWTGPCKPVPTYVYLTSCPYPVLDTHEKTSCPYPDSLTRTTCDYLDMGGFAKNKTSFLYPFGFVEGIEVTEFSANKVFIRGAIIESIGNNDVSDVAVSFVQKVKYSSYVTQSDSIQSSDVSDISVSLIAKVKYGTIDSGIDTIASGGVSEVSVNWFGRGVVWDMGNESMKVNSISEVSVNFI